MPFTVRDFQPSDFETLWRIDQACFAAGISYSRAELSYYIRRPEAFTLLAMRIAPRTMQDGNAGPAKQIPPDSPNGSIAGFIVAELERGSGHIVTIDVLRPARRLGVGSLLLRSAEDRLRAAGCRLVDLETAVDNVSALSFYKRHGYSVVGTWPRYYSNGVDALVLQKPLHQNEA